jgi:hypothetical protein
MVVVVVLPLSEFVVEDLRVVDHETVEQGVELFGVDAMDRSTLPFRRGVRGLM